MGCKKQSKTKTPASMERLVTEPPARAYNPVRQNERGTPPTYIFGQRIRPLLPAPKPRHDSPAVMAARHFDLPDELRDAQPKDLFSLNYPTSSHTLSAGRLVRKTEDSQCLIYIAGAGPGDDANDPRGGCGVVLHKELEGKPGTHGISIRLEQRGPSSPLSQKVSLGRAEVRAVDLALHLRPWPEEGFKCLVIATDSEHLVEAATALCRDWCKNFWKKPDGEAVADQDLWKVSLERIAHLWQKGTRVLFWHIRPE